ncbi:hypothetical protein AB7V66_20610 [Providencia rettgeri]
MITKEQIKEDLAAQGISLPEFILDAFVEQANSIQECLDNHYSSATAILIQSCLISLMALSKGDKYISSQSAPNGASRSFRYQSFGDRWKAATSLLRGLDKYGCANELIPPDPTQTAHAGLWIAKGGCMCGGGR